MIWRLQNQLLVKKCKEDIIKALKEYKNISKINIIPVLDKSDKKIFPREYR